MTHGLSVAIIAGGPSGEAAVSRTSAAAVRQALERTGHRPVVYELEPDLAGELREQRPDVAFPVTHGPVGEDGCLQGLLEVLGLRYVGSAVLASALAASKPHAKTLFQLAGLPVARDALVARGEDLADRAAELHRELGRELAVKPASGGSAIGVELLRRGEDRCALVAALERTLQWDSCALVECYLAGCEVTCGVLEEEDERTRALPPTLILSKAADFYNFESKYAPGGSEHRCPAGFTEPVTRRIQQLAVLAHRAVSARDLSRVDFILGDAQDADTLTVLEVNTLPGMTATSLYPEAARAAGIDFPSLCDRLARRAYARPGRATPSVIPMP